MDFETITEPLEFGAQNKERKKINRQSITIGTPGFEKLSKALD